MNILVVDDNKMNIMIASKFLKKWQANVDEALNGLIAVDMAGDKAYDLIIMDLQMPVMDGFEASAIINTTTLDYLSSPLLPMLCPKRTPKLLNMACEITSPNHLCPRCFSSKISRHCKPVITQNI
jgi:two-component system sensor histidine kinase/response regulator